MLQVKQWHIVYLLCATVLSWPKLYCECDELSTTNQIAFPNYIASNECTYRLYEIKRHSLTKPRMASSTRKTRGVRRECRVGECWLMEFPICQNSHWIGQTGITSIYMAVCRALLIFCLYYRPMNKALLHLWLFQFNVFYNILLRKF